MPQMRRKPSSISSGSWTARFARASAARSSRRQQNGNRRSGKSSPGFSWRNRSGRSILHRWMVFTRWLLPMQTGLRPAAQPRTAASRCIPMAQSRSASRKKHRAARRSCCTSTYSPAMRHIWVCGSATVWTPWSKHWKPKTPSRASIGSSTTTTALRMAPASPSASRKRTDVSRSCSCMLTDTRCAEFHAQI